MYFDLDGDAADREAGEALLRLLRGCSAEHARSLTLSQWKAITALALHQGVAPLLQRQLRAGGGLAEVPAALAGRLGQEHHDTALRNLGNYGEFRRVARILDDAGIPFIALKGLHLADLVYGDIGLRPMSDLDILVARAQLEPALAALRAGRYGYNETLAASSDAMANVNEIVLVREDHGGQLDVHWRLNEPREAADELLAQVWRCARPAHLGGVQALVLSPEFLLLHVCAHFACSDVFAFNIRPLCDIAEIVRTHPALDWAVVIEHGLRYGWTRGIAAALRLAHDQLAVPVPGRALAALGGDTLDSAMLCDAIAQSFAASTLPEGLVIAPNLLALSGTASLAAKASLVWRRVFVPRAELSLLYDVPAESVRLPLYYALRLRDLARRYAASARALIAGDPALAESHARHARLQRWIRGGSDRG
jgi:hypothetical protein